MKTRLFDRYQIVMKPPELPVKERIRELEVNLGHTDEMLFDVLRHPLLDDPRAEKFLIRIGALEAHCVLAAKAARALLDDLDGLKGQTP
jgi:hypothetical protein